MLEKKKSIGYFIAVDGPNGVGKSTLIAAIKNKLEILRGLNSLFAGMRSITKCNTR